MRGGKEDKLAIISPTEEIKSNDGKKWVEESDTPLYAKGGKGGDQDCKYRLQTEYSGNSRLHQSTADLGGVSGFSVKIEGEDPGQQKKLGGMIFLPRCLVKAHPVTKRKEARGHTSKLRYHQKKKTINVYKRKDKKNSQAKAGGPSCQLKLI